MKINKGDLVEVVYLDQMMYHFDVTVGVVVQLSRNGDFFIQKVNANGKLIRGSSSGWYSSENVEVLVSKYKRGVLDGKVVYQEVYNLSGLISTAKYRCSLLAAKYDKLAVDRWEEFMKTTKREPL